MATGFYDEIRKIEAVRAERLWRLRRRRAAAAGERLTQPPTQLDRPRRKQPA